MLEINKFLYSGSFTHTMRYTIPNSFNDLQTNVMRSTEQMTVELLICRCHVYAYQLSTCIWEVPSSYNFPHRIPRSEGQRYQLHQYVEQFLIN